MQKLTDQFDLFIFDWDGTLRTSSFFVRLSNIFKGRYNPDYVKQHKDEFNPTVAIKYIPQEERESMFYSNLYDLYSSVTKPRLREGAIPALQLLKRRKKKVALFSDAREYRIMKEIRNLKAAPYFDFVLCADMIGLYKPDPSGINLVIKKMKVPKARVIYMGDMGIDMLTAKFGKISGCGIEGGLDGNARLKSANPDFVFRDLHDFSKHL